MDETEIRGSGGRAPDERCTEVLPRVSATFAGACLLLHIAMVFVAGSDMLAMSLPMLGLAALCAGCAVSAWRRGCSDRELGLTALVAGAMVSFHLILISSPASQAICGSMADSPVMGSMPGISWMSGVGGGGNRVSAFTELLMPAGVAFAGIAGLIATSELAKRLLARGYIRNNRGWFGRGAAESCRSMLKEPYLRASTGLMTGKETY